MKYMNFLKKGFTFIEMLVVTALIMLFAGLTLAFYNDFTGRTEFSSETDRFVAVLELARKKASSGDISPLSTCTNFGGYMISTNSSNSYFSMFFCCNSLCTTEVKKYYFQSNVTASTGNILFQPKAKNVTNGAGGVPLPITISGIKCRDINISTRAIISLSTVRDCP